MTNITSVTVTAGVPTAGTGTVSTLDNLIGVAGTPSAQVLTVQGASSGTALKVDPSGVTSPVSLASVPSHAVTNAGTFAVQVTSAPTTAVTLATAPALVASSAIIGKVGIDQTTPGTTNKVSIGTDGTVALAAGSAAIGSVTISNANANGQAAMAASAPVVIASDQSALTFQLASAANLAQGAITTAMTGTTTTSLLAAPGASLHNMITQVTVSNAHATVGTDIVLQDGSGGTAFYTIPAAANYGGATLTFDPPLRQPTANTALFVANVTTGASTKASANGFKAA